MQSFYPVEKAIRPGCPLSIGGKGQELRYVAGLYIPPHRVLADAIFPRYAAICALPSRQQLLDSKALLVRANGADPTQLLLLIHAGSGLGWFAALVRASRLASRASLNWFLRRFTPRSFLPPSLSVGPRLGHASIRMAERLRRPHVAVVVGGHTSACCRPA